MPKFEDFMNKILKNDAYFDNLTNKVNELFNKNEHDNYILLIDDILEAK